MEAFSDCKVIAIHGDGGAIHTPDEFLCVDSLVERARLSTLLLMRLAQGHLKTAA
jgi:glutamate carboxypeptidase